MVECMLHIPGGFQIEPLLIYLGIYTVLLFLRDLILIGSYLVHRLLCGLQNVRSSIEIEVCCACMTRDGSFCREMECLEYDRSFLRARYNVISVRFMSLKELAYSYRQELKRLRDSRFESGKMYLEVLKRIEESWIAELEQKNREYTRLLEVRSYLECEFNGLRATLIPGLDLSDSLFDDSDLDYDHDVRGLMESNVKETTLGDDREALGSTASSDTTEDFDLGSSDTTDFKMKICFFIQQSLLCNSSPTSMLVSLEIAALSSEFCRKKCILGIVLGTLKYLDATNSFYCFSKLYDVFSKLDLLFAHFVEKIPDQFAILDEVLNFCSECSLGFSACPLIVAAMCRSGIIDVFASSKWFKNCTDTTVLSYSVELLEWIHSEQHGSYCILQRAPDRPGDPSPEEMSLLESCPLAPHPHDSSCVPESMDPTFRISTRPDSCVFLNGDIPFPPPGAFLPKQSPLCNGFPGVFDTNSAREDKCSSSSGEDSCSTRHEDFRVGPRVRKTVSFDTATHIIS